MPDSFRSRIPTLPDSELQRYLDHPSDYRIEAVAAAMEELDRRGHPVSAADQARIRAGHAGASTVPGPGPWALRLLGASLESRLRRVRLLTGGILVLGLGSAAAIYATATARSANPLGYEPEDTKKYLRDLELYGGKLNVIATQFRRWFEGLWQGQNLAYTLAALTLLLAIGFWWVATRVPLEAGPRREADRS